MVLAVVGIALMVGAALCLWGRSRSLAKAGKLRAVAQKTVAEVLSGQGGVVGVRGEVSCESPISGELSGASCVYYRSKVEREYEEDYSEWNEQEKRNERKTRRNRTTVSSNSRHCPFTVRDATGEIQVFPDQADIDAERVLSRFEPERSGFSLTVGGFTLSMAGVNASSPGHRTIGYHLEEYALPVRRPVYIMGEASTEGGAWNLHKPSDRTMPYVISMKSREETIKSTETTAKLLMVVAGLLFLGGIACVIAGLMNS